MRLAWLFTAAGGAALATLLVFAGGMIERPEEEPATASIAAAPKATGSSVGDAGPETPPVEARRIGSTLIAPPPIEPSELERVAPREPLSELALALPPETGAAEQRLLYRPVATAAGRVEAQGHVIALKGIVAIEPDETCQSADGSSWPCGMVARTAFRNWLRGRAIACTVSEQKAEEVVVTECSLGDEDIALWLASSGYVTAEPGGPYAEAGKAAEAEGLGIFGDGPQR